MEENTQLPKEVVKEIHANADAYINSYPDEGTEWGAYISGATAYATKLYQANETIKVLTYDNNRLKGEVEGLKGQSGAVWVKAKPANNGFYAVKYTGGGYGGCGFKDGKWNQSLADNKIVAYLDESAAGREEDKAHFDNWHRWLSDNGYTYDGEYYYDEDNNYFTPDQLWVKFK